MTVPFGWWDVTEVVSLAELVSWNIDDGLPVEIRDGRAYLPVYATLEVENYD